MGLAEKLAEMGEQLFEREVANAPAMAATRQRAEVIQGKVRTALAGYAKATRPMAQLAVQVSDPRVDDKHLHAVQFDITRGRHQVIVTAKCKGVVTLVGPFKQGDEEGPCRRIDLEDDAAIEAGLEVVLLAFLEAAFAP